MAAVMVQQSYIKTQSGWNSGLCDCCQDCNSCCYGFWCFPCFMCTTSGEFGESTCLPLLDIFGPCLLASFGIVTCVPPVSLGMRVAVRHKYDIGGSICNDIMLSCCCVWCSWCQMSREIKARKQNFTLVQTVPAVFQPMSTNTRVVSTQQSFAPAIQMQPIQTGPHNTTVEQNIQ